MGLLWIPIEKTWRLNERHYGALQGLNKKETVDQHGADQVIQTLHVIQVVIPFPHPGAVPHLMRQLSTCFSTLYSFSLSLSFHSIFTACQRQPSSQDTRH